MMRAGKEETSRVLTLVVHRKTAPQLVEEFHQQAKYYILHRFENHWQRACMKEAVKDVEPVWNSVKTFVCSSKTKCRVCTGLLSRLAC